MIYTIIAVLFVLWLIGLLTSYTAGGLLHLLLVLCVVLFVYQIITGRNVR